MGFKKVKKKGTHFLFITAALKSITVLFQQLLISRNSTFVDITSDINSFYKVIKIICTFPYYIWVLLEASNFTFTYVLAYLIRFD